MQIKNKEGRGYPVQLYLIADQRWSSGVSSSIAHLLVITNVIH
jgi:hypothetical protein